VDELLRGEEQLDPDAVYAEIVHLPEGRLGNILCRPVLRTYEIPYLGRSGAPADRCLPLSDLFVTVRGDEIHLRSRRLGRRVVPRLTSAHNYQDANLRIYRFLCRLQNLSALQYLVWKWEPLTSFSFLPRVVSGRLVLARARWQLRSPEIEALAKASGVERLRAVHRWRAERRLPRFVAFTEWDNELPVDLDNPLAVDSFLDTVRQRPAVELRELFPEHAELCARGPEGRFVHEILVPFVRSVRSVPVVAQPASISPPVAVSAVRPAPAEAPAVVTRAFPPGSEWLYAKLYTGTATADRLLRELVSPLRAESLRSGAAGRWFFIRYGDPEWHLRLRFHGAPERLFAELMPQLTAAAQEMLADGRLAKLQLDTYDREVERYGGPAGVEIAERLFQADSEAVLEIVESIDGDEAADVRWRLALAGVDRLLSDLGFDLAAKGAIGERLRDHTGYAHALGERFRRERPRLAPLLDPARDNEGDLAPGLALLRRRSQTLAPLVAELRALESEGRLTRSVEELAASFIHMHVNRMIRAGGPEHERVIYDFLARLYESRRVRERAGSTA